MPVLYVCTRSCSFFCEGVRVRDRVRVGVSVGVNVRINIMFELEVGVLGLFFFVWVLGLEF
jgi:hypothetical protein